MLSQTVYLAGIGAVPLSAIPTFIEVMATVSGQPTMSGFDEAPWLIRKCGFRL